MTRFALAIWTLVYMTAVVLANVLTDHYGLVAVGWGLLVTAGTYAAGAALFARDFLQRHATDLYGTLRGILYVLAAIAVAGVVSAITASPGLALASTLAFLTAEAVDLAVFTPLRERAGFAVSVLVSNVVSAPVDTVMFLWVAGFPVTVSAVTGQFIGKVLWATLVPLLLWAAYTATRDRSRVLT